MKPTSLVLALLLSACGATIGELHPQPHVALARSPRRIALVLKFIPDDFRVDHRVLMSAVHVKRFHTTLENGFRQAYGAALELVPDYRQADLVLVVSRATPQLTVSHFGTPNAEYNMRLVYQAELRDHGGQVLHRFDDTAIASGAGWYGEGLAAAVALMYEAIGQRLPPPAP